MSDTPVNYMKNIIVKLQYLSQLQLMDRKSSKLHHKYNYTKLKSILYVTTHHHQQHLYIYLLHNKMINDCVAVDGIW